MFGDTISNVQTSLEKIHLSKPTTCINLKTWFICWITFFIFRFYVCLKSFHNYFQFCKILMKYFFAFYFQFILVQEFCSNIQGVPQNNDLQKLFVLFWLFLGCLNQQLSYALYVFQQSFFCRQQFYKFYSSLLQSCF